MFNKKGEGPGLGTIITLGVALVAAVLIILYFFDFFNTASDFTKIAPSALSAKAEVCKGIATSQVAYCEFTQVEKDKYINCAYDDLDFRTEIRKVISDAEAPKCNSEGPKNFCLTLNPSDPTKVLVNDKLCSDHLKSTGAA